LRFLNFIIGSHVFRWISVFSILLVLVVYFSNKLFDALWQKSAAVPLLDLSIVYKPPKNYDDFKKLNLQLLNKNYFAIEANKKFRIAGKDKAFDYYDTIPVKHPDQTFDFVNKIFLQFENSKDIDSISFVISKSVKPQIYWNQIFYSSVHIEKLNSFSKDIEEFRVNENSVVEQQLLENNDTLISKALNYFDEHNLFNPDCGKNCYLFKDVCSKFNLPCRITGLQGGNAFETGFNDIIGYPLHAICEVYSSKHKKWYVIDPTYGLRFKNITTEDYLNAVEISNIFYFNREKFIIQDPALKTIRPIAGRDYYKYYENIYYINGFILGQPWKRIMQITYKKFDYDYYHYSLNLSPIKNGYYYVILKTVVYLFISLLYFNAILLVLTQRLFSVKKPKD